MTTNTKDVTPQQRIALLKHLTNDKTPEAVATILNITRDQVVEVARHHGYPDAAKMKWAIDILVDKQLEAEKTLPIHAAPRPAAPVNLTVTNPGATSSGPVPTKPDEIRVLLNTAKAHPSKRIQAAADRVFDQLDKLRGLIREDQEKHAEKRRQAEDRAKARAEVARLEQELRTARAKLRSNPPHTTTASSSDDGPSSKEIRSWAAANGVECTAVGRVPTAVREAYEHAHESDVA